MSTRYHAQEYEDLLTPPPKRAGGISSQYWGTTLVVGFGCLVVLLPIVGFAIYRAVGSAGFNSGFFRGFACFGGILIGLLMLGGVFGLSPQWRSVRYSRKRHGEVWDAIKSAADPARGERHIEFVPELHVGDRQLFIASYRHKNDRQRLVPIATILLDENGRILESDQLFEKAYVTYSFALFTTSKAQSLLDQWRRNTRKTLTKAIPRAKASILANMKRFSMIGEGVRAQQAAHDLATFSGAMTEVERFLEARQGYVKAVGYGQRPVYLFEDADRLDRLGEALGRKLESDYGQKLLDLSSIGESLTQVIESHPGGWRDRKALRRALTLVAGSRTAIQKWIDDFGDEVRVPEPTWKNYHNKTRWLRSQGIPVHPD